VRAVELTTARTVSFATLGCRLNQVDTQQLQTMLEARGFTTVDFDEPADVVVVNTCTVTARAEFSDRQMIRRAARVSPGAKLVVTGCWAQTSPGDVAAMGEVDLVVGNGDKDRLPDLLDRVVAGKTYVSDIARARTVEVAPVARLREFVLAMRAVWDCWQNGTKLAFKGQFYRFDLMTPFFNPGPIAEPKVPIYIAGVNHYMCRIAGEVCDGLHVHPFNSPKYLREYVHPAVDEGLKTSGRKRADFTYTTASFAVVGDTEEELARNRQSVKQQIAFYASTRTYEPVLAAHGWQDLTPALHRKSVEGDWQGMADLITDEMLETFAVTGTYDTIGRRLKERYAGLLDSTALYQPYQPGLDDPRLPRLVKEFNG